MLPRNDKIFFIMIICLIFFCAIPSARAENIFIKFYQDHLSAINGNRCPMYPSCSAYASQAIEKHGSVIGWVMACDRLVRCSRNEAEMSKAIIIKGHKLVHDPVGSNDFWWFEKEKKK